MSNEFDTKILYSLSKWRFLLSRHIVKLFNCSARTTYRRLKALEETKYIKKDKILYGIPSLYYLSHKGKKLVGENTRPTNFKFDQIKHDILVIDCAFYFADKYELTFDEITTEKELHSLQGFGTRQHVADFVFYKDGKSFAVEVELSLKNKETLKKNINLNFINYDYQIWIISKSNKKLEQRLLENESHYPNISIEYLEELFFNAGN